MFLAYNVNYFIYISLKSREVEASIMQFSVPPEGSGPLHFESTYSQNMISQFKICLWKQNLVYYRSPNYNAVRILFTVGSALIIGSVFWDRGSKRYFLLCEAFTENFV